MAVQTLTLQPAEATAEDSWIWAASPTTNNGSDTLIYIGSAGGAIRGIYRFDLASILGSVVSSATLALYVTAGAASEKPGKTLRVTQAWVEAQVTWNVYATAQNWSGAGGDTDSTVSDAWTGTTGTGFWTLTVTNCIADAVKSRAGVASLLVKYDTEDGGTNDPIIATKSSSNVEPTHWPILTVNYVTGTFRTPRLEDWP